MIVKRFRKLFDINSRRFIEFMINIINRYDNISQISFDEEERLMLNMMYYTFYNNEPDKEGVNSLRECINKLLKNKIIMKEVGEILTYNYNHLDFIDKKVDLGFPCPLDLHCLYSSSQILSALGYYNEKEKPSFREGIKYFEDKKLDALFITLNKSDKDFSPSTLYDDYAINEKRFHWQSQSSTSVTSPTGERYINHKKLNSKIILFVREYKKEGSYTFPFTYLGTCEYKSHQGSKPISFVWELHEEIPPSMINKANKTIIV